MKTLVAMLLLLTSSICAAQTKPESAAPPTDEQQLAEHQKTLQILQAKIEQRKREGRAREIAGIQASAEEASDAIYKAGVVVSLAFNGDDSAVLGSPAVDWMWVVDGPDGQRVLHGKAVKVVAKHTGVYTVALTVFANGGHRQQSHRYTFKVNPPVEWEREQ